jgi:hypothetical protein
MTSISDIEKKRGRGRPPKDIVPVLVRLPVSQADALDVWRAGQDDKPTRPEAIRRLVDLALKATPKP